MAIKLEELNNNEYETFMQNSKKLATDCRLNIEDAKLILTENVSEEEVKKCEAYDFVKNIKQTRKKYDIHQYLSVLKQILENQKQQELMDKLNKDNEFYQKAKQEYQIVWDKMWLNSHCHLVNCGAITKEQYPQAFIEEQKIRDNLNIHNKIPFTQEEYNKICDRRRELNVLLGYDENDMDT